MAKNIQGEVVEEKTTAISVKQKQEVMAESHNEISVEALLSQAVDKGLSVETLEKLLAMRKELKAEKAKEMFDFAMAQFQGNCPIIEKTTNVLNKDGKTVRYSYAKLDSIVCQTKDLISQNGFSYAFDEEKDDKFIKIICTVTHSGGYSKQTAFKIPIGTEEFMSDIQKHGARMTFGKRYAFCNAFGIMTGDEDKEEKLKDKENEKTDEELKPFADKILGCKNIGELMQVWANTPAEIKIKLNSVKEQMKTKLI